MRHFIDLKQWDKSQLHHLLQLAQELKSGNVEPSLAHYPVANLFFEPSTRTRCSFELAAKQLGAEVINIDSHLSSIQKGETAIDTALNLKAMGIKIFIIRHKQNDMVQQIADALGNDVAVINAGCGTKQHPSQALLDMFTIMGHKQQFTNLTVSIVGDMLHSRVTYSDVTALQILGVKQINLVAPKQLLPELTAKNIHCFDNINQGLDNSDVIIALRIQKERMDHENLIDYPEFIQRYQLTNDRLQLAKPDAIVMHPGPMNRGVEITDSVADGKQSVILQQAANGVFCRMALLQYVVDASIAI